MKKESTYLSDNYASLYKKLEKVTLLFLNTKSKNDLKDFILKQKGKNESGLKNTLIEIPSDNIKSIIRNDYTKIDYLTGNLGTVDATDQFDGITNMALLMLMSNRLAKHYRYENNNELPEKTQELYRKNEITSLRWKDMAMKDLIASLYILTKTEDEYKNFISYGYRKDSVGNDSFVIDLPFFGQVCVHFGNKFQSIMKNAQETVIGILESKHELGQISQEEFESLLYELNDTSILPDYTGKLYEYNAGLPIEYEGSKIKSIKKQLGFDKKLPEDIEREDIMKIWKSGLNSREAYYFSVKLGLSKELLEQIVEMNDCSLDSRKIGKSALKATTVEERMTVAVQERNRQLSFHNHDLNK